MAKRTLQEIANFFDMAVAIDEDGSVWMHPTMPKRSNNIWRSKGGNIYIVDRYLVDNAENLRGSLTLPDSWTKVPPFKEGELIVSIALGLDCISYWHSPACNKELWRRPTEEEWKRLKGEER